MEYNENYLKNDLNNKKDDMSKSGYDFEATGFDNDVLDFLKRQTTLGPIATMKVNRAKATAIKFQDMYNQLEKDKIGADFTDANELEYQLRMRAWENKYSKLWEMYGDGLSLSEFAQMTLEQQMKNEYSSGHKKS